MPIILMRSSEVPIESQFYDELRRLIDVGEYPAGKVLSVKELADVVILPRPQVRAILERLVQEGYVQPGTQKGLFVVFCAN